MMLTAADADDGPGPSACPWACVGCAGDDDARGLSLALLALGLGLGLGHFLRTHAKASEAAAMQVAQGLPETALSALDEVVGAVHEVLLLFW
jgi:hypothetical protein